MKEVYATNVSHLMAAMNPRGLCVKRAPNAFEVSTRFLRHAFLSEQNIISLKPTNSVLILICEMSGKEDMVSCPYNVSHVVLKSRMPTHLIKCRQQHPVERFETCPFNSTHDVPAPELQYHMEYCPDRKNLEDYIYCVDKPKVDDPGTFDVQVPSSSENWDEEGSSSTSYLNVRDKALENQTVFRQPTGKSKAERKAFTFDEVQRFEKVSVKKSTNGTTK